MQRLNGAWGGLLRRTQHNYAYIAYITIPLCGRQIYMLVSKYYLPMFYELQRCLNLSQNYISEWKSLVHAFQSGIFTWN